MYFKHKITLMAITAMMMLAACDDNTSTMGIYPVSDGITNSTGIYQLSTRSVRLDSVTSNSSVCYLGNITDPETDADIKADFVAQFNTSENYTFPKKEQMMGMIGGEDKKGVIQCDSIEVRLFFNNFYGDGNNPMKVEVYELDTKNILSEDSIYYATQDLTQFIKAGSKPIGSRMFTPTDFSIDDTDRNTTTYTPNLCIALNNTIGQKMMEKYYENPTYYRNSYSFIRNVMPGLYFRTTGGRGTMLNLYVSTLNVYFHYYDEKADTVYAARARFSATPEVIQSTSFQNGDMESLLADNSCTYLKTPAGIATEMTLPVDEVFAGKHANDSVSMASVTLTRYNKEQNSYQLGTPTYLLMVRKQDYTHFFANRQVANNHTSYTTAFNSVFNTYTFDNIGRLLSYCKHEKANKARERGISEEQWMQENPDWNKVLLIPVSVATSEVTANGITTSTPVAVNHDMSLKSIRLVGGNTKLNMQVVYSKFHQ